MNVPSEITLHLASINELFRAPISLYHKRALKNDAEELIVEEADALPRKGTISMKIHIALSELQHKDEIAPAIKRHFCCRREQSKKKFKRVLQYGWKKLFIALVLLAAIYTLTEIALHFIPENRVILFIRESFIILGWVALWRPLDILLYDWYPIKTNINLYSRLEHSTIQVIINES